MHAPASMPMASMGLRRMSGEPLALLQPDWPAPANDARRGDTPPAGRPHPYASLSLGDHVGDDPAAVAENRTPA